jgi:hypothetical protein
MEVQAKNYHGMSLVELKQEAKNHDPPIPGYWNMKKVNLIYFLTLKQLPEHMIIKKKTIKQLREEAKARGFQGISKLKRHELGELLYPGSQKYYQNDYHAEKHDDPQKGESKKVGI